MDLRINDYGFGRRAVVLAKGRSAKDDVLARGLPAISVSEKGVCLYPECAELQVDDRTLDALHSYNDYDVLVVYDDGSIQRFYDDSSGENYLFVTALCNSNCIMCPSSEYERRHASQSDIETILSVARLIPDDVSHLTVTGGEPFMAGKSLFSLFALMKGRLPNTDILVLTNGRIFAVEEYADLLEETVSGRTILAIPLHGPNAEIHDRITQSPGSFEQTVKGLMALLSRRVKVELRIVVSRLNAIAFDALSEFVVDSFPNVEYVSVMAMEMTGNAWANRDMVWLPYSELFASISSGVKKMVESGIDVKLYNFPLCTVPRCYWTLCKRSIATRKVRYSANVCSRCLYKDSCGGVFAGTYSLEKDDLRTLS